MIYRSQLLIKDNIENHLEQTNVW